MDYEKDYIEGYGKGFRAGYVEGYDTGIDVGNQHTLNALRELKKLKRRFLCYLEQELKNL